MLVLIDLSTLQKFDSQGMYQTYDKWNVISSESYETDYNMADFTDIDNIVFAGWAVLEQSIVVFFAGTLINNLHLYSNFTIIKK